MEIPPPLSNREARQILQYLFWLVLTLIIAIFVLSLQGREYPEIFKDMAWLIVGAIIGALKLQVR